MADFRDLVDGGQRLAKQVGHLHGHVVGIEPNGGPAAQAVAHALGTTVSYVRRVNEGDAFEINATISGPAVVCDCGVETGRAAVTLGRQLRDMGVNPLVLAVPVCPREIEPLLREVYDEIVAVVRPLARRSLSWHYDSM